MPDLDLNQYHVDEYFQLDIHNHDQGRLEYNPDKKILHVWSGLGDAESYGFRIPVTSDVQLRILIGTLMCAKDQPQIPDRY